MAYEKQTWQTGDVVTSAKLNHMEDGIAGAGGGGVVATLGQETGALNKTFGEIKTALLSKAQIWLAGETPSGVNYFPADNIVANTAGGGTITLTANGSSITLTAATDSDYPAMEGPK